MVAEYVSGLKAAWDVAKALKTATDAIDDAHIKLQMAELISALADAKIEAAESAEKIAILENRLNAKCNFEFDGKKYFKMLPDERREGPYCPTCYDSNEKQIRLQNYPGAIGGDWRCKVCNGGFR
ncbi:hypothetical protein J4H24_23175 [Vibrio alginolyticus]|uniref:hypothetical protein n=1 Tax=Vibrio alginolyticus TaxID=663 RepID=UPI001BD5AA62|nr:hypothetical protein [Vibrio alginolyticus]MBT0055135.1 hypothetical protein [Vibrio alginolyticus]